jgi:hypothetical protein
MLQGLPSDFDDELMKRYGAGLFVARSKVVAVQPLGINYFASSIRSWMEDFSQQYVSVSFASVVDWPTTPAI